MGQLIVMSGLPGTGKSTLAQGLCRQLCLPVFSVDPIESAILRAGIPQSFETGLAGYLVADVLADAQLQSGHGAIIDAVNAEEPGKDMWRTSARKHGVPLKIIECYCSNEALHRERLESRRRGLALFPEPTWDAVQKRRQAYTRWTEPVLSVDGALPLEESLRRAIAWLSRQE